MFSENTHFSDISLHVAVSPSASVPAAAATDAADTPPPV